MKRTSLVTADELSRRTFAASAAKTLLGVGLGPLVGPSIATASMPNAKPRSAGSVIYLNLMGGMSHLDTFDLKPDMPDVQGPVRPVAANVPGIRVSHYLPKLAQQMDKLAVIRSMSSNQGDHPAGQYLLHRSYMQSGTISHPTLAAWVMHLQGKANPEIPGCVSIAGNPDSISPGFLEPRNAPLPIGDPQQGLPDGNRPSHVNDSRFERRLAMVRSLNQEFRDRFDYRTTRAQGSLFAEAVRLLKSDDLKAFDIGCEPAAVHEEYGSEKFSQGCLLARRLVEFGVRFVEVGLGGWDTHYDNFSGVASLAGILDRALSALLVDLQRRGMLEDTLVVVGTEFGRSPKILPAHNNGRDHHPQAFTCVLAGGGVAGGQIYGETDRRGAEVVDRPVSIPDLNATIAWALGLPVTEEYTAPSGQAFLIADQGIPVLELF